MNLNKLVQRVSGLQGTGDLTDWEEQFVSDIVKRTQEGSDTRSLTEKQIDVLERIFNKHFAG